MWVEFTDLFNKSKLTRRRVTNLKIGPTKGKRQKKGQKSQICYQTSPNHSKGKNTKKGRKKAGDTMGKTHGMVRGPRQRGAHALIHKEGKVNNDQVKTKQGGGDTVE